jgi:hypothetical protein
MGVAGSCKTTVGRLLAADLGWSFYERERSWQRSGRRRRKGRTFGPQNDDRKRIPCPSRYLLLQSPGKRRYRPGSDPARSSLRECQALSHGGACRPRRRPREARKPLGSYEPPEGQGGARAGRKSPAIHTRSSGEELLLPEASRRTAWRGGGTSRRERAEPGWPRCRRRLAKHQSAR